MCVLVGTLVQGSPSMHRGAGDAQPKQSLPAVHDTDGGETSCNARTVRAHGRSKDDIQTGLDLPLFPGLRVMRSRHTQGVLEQATDPHCAS